MLLNDFDLLFKTLNSLFCSIYATKDFAESDEIYYVLVPLLSAKILILYALRQYPFNPTILYTCVFYSHE